MVYIRLKFHKVHAALTAYDCDMDLLKKAIYKEFYEDKPPVSVETVDAEIISATYIHLSMGMWVDREFITHRYEMYVGADECLHWSFVPGKPLKLPLAVVAGRKDL